MLATAMANVAAARQQPVCDIVALKWLKDGCYLPWKELTSINRLRTWASQKLLKGYEMVFHTASWVDVSTGCTWGDAQTARDAVVAGSSPSASLEPSLAPSAKRMRTTPPAPDLWFRRPSFVLDIIEMSRSTRAETFLRTRANEYVVGEVMLGQGTFAKVFPATRDGSTVVVKSFKLHSLTSRADVAAEAYVHERSIEHPHLVQALDVFTTQAGVHLVLEHAGQDLEVLFQNGFEPSQLRSIALQILRALQYLHDELGLIHGDVTAENCLQTSLSL